MPSGERLFVSYTDSDKDWAEWIAWQIEAAGYPVELQAWDFRPGEHFIERMNQALERADRVVAVLSDAYLAAPYAGEEWWSALLRGRGQPARLLPVRVQPCTLPPLLQGRNHIDLVGLDEAEASARLRQGLAASLEGARGKPAVAPLFPGGQPPFPGTGPAIWSTPTGTPATTSWCGGCWPTRPRRSSPAGRARLPPGPGRRAGPGGHRHQGGRGPRPAARMAAGVRQRRGRRLLRADQLDLAGYLARFPTRRRELLARGTPADYPWTVATTWR